MQTQPQVTFDDIAIDEAVREAAFDHVEQLERYSDRITGCHVVVAQPHRRHREGRLYSVRIDLLVPGGEIVVNREHHLEHAHEDALVALRDAFLAARRQLEDHVRRLRGAEKRHAVRPRGRVTQVFPLAGYGFLVTPDGREVYFHRHAMSDRDFRRLDVGSSVVFGEGEGEDGPQATYVRLVRGSVPQLSSETSPAESPASEEFPS
jgi:cold shock CspA family protein